MPIVMDTLREQETEEASLDSISRSKMTNNKLIMKTFLLGALKEKEQVTITFYT